MDGGNSRKWGLSNGTGTRTRIAESALRDQRANSGPSRYRSHIRPGIDRNDARQCDGDRLRRFHQRGRRFVTRRLDDCRQRHHGKYGSWCPPPPAGESDRAGLVAALSTLGVVEPEDARVLGITDTIRLDRMYASTALVEEASDRSDLAVHTDPTRIEFDGVRSPRRRPTKRRDVRRPFRELSVRPRTCVREATVISHSPHSSDRQGHGSNCLVGSVPGHSPGRRPSEPLCLPSLW